jgi:hypothetical protein
MDTNQGSDKRKNNDDLPGYPHYPAEEDILNPGNGMKKVGGDVEDLANSNALSRRGASGKDISTDTIENISDKDEIGIVPGTEADVTNEDLILLGERDADQDMGEDEDAADKARVDNVDGDNEALEEYGLDIPGDDLDDEDEAIGEEDEENNYYSLGGDNHDNLEEDQA